MDQLLERGLPSDPDAERYVLGVILQLGGEAMDEPDLRPADFYLPRHKLIYLAMGKLREEGMPVEFAAICGVLRDQGDLEKAGGMTYVASLIDGIPAGGHLYYAERIKSKALQRRLIKLAGAIQTHALDAESGSEALEFAERALFRVSDEAEGGKGHGEAIGDVADNYLEGLERRIGSGQEPDRTTTGLRDLDEIIVSLEPESLTLVGARPSNGKTSMGLTLALNCASKGQPAVFFSLEMSGEAIAQRLLSMLAKVSLQDMRRGRVMRDEWAKLVGARAKLESLPLIVDDGKGLTAGQVCARMRRHRQQKGVRVAIVDYLTRLRFAGRREQRHELGDAAKALKDSAGELGIAVVGLSQLSRASVAGGHVRKPQLSDLRESGSLEEDADTVLFVHRDEMYSPTNENRGIADVIVAKQRQGPAPEFVKVAFLGDYVKFENLWK